MKEKNSWTKTMKTFPPQPTKIELKNIKSDRRKEHLNQEDEEICEEVKEAFSIINDFANEPCQEKENCFYDALNIFKSYLIHIQQSPSSSNSEYESTIPLLIKIFLETDDQSKQNEYFLEIFHHITSVLPNEKIYEYFSNEKLCTKLFNYISKDSWFPNISSRVVSHLIISSTITDFYDIHDFLDVAPFINNMPDRAYFLYMLPEVGVPSELFSDFLRLVIDTFDIEDSECVDYCCKSICNCIEDENENEDGLPIPEINSCLTNIKLVKPIIKIFECLFDNQICTKFFSDDDFINLLLQISMSTLMSQNDDQEYFFQIIFPFISDIFYKCQLSVTQELFSTIISVALEGSFKLRSTAFLFINSVFDHIIIESPEYFNDCKFYELLVEMVMTNIDDVLSQIIECINKLLSSQQCNFTQYIMKLPGESLEQFMDELDRIDDETDDSDISRNIYYIKSLIKKSLPRPYECVDDL